MNGPDEGLAPPSGVLGCYQGAAAEPANYSTAAASLCIHAAGVAALLLLGPAAAIQSVMYVPRQSIALVPASAEPAPAPRIRVPRVTAPPVASARLFLPPPAESRPAPSRILEEAPALEPLAARPEPVVVVAPPPVSAPAPAVPQPPAVTTNVFAAAAPSPPAAAFSVPRRTESAGFDQAARATLPSTPRGNPVASSGFDAAPAGPAAGRGMAGAVQVGAFGQAAAAASRITRATGFARTAFDSPEARPAAVPRPATPPPAAIRPVEILDKPKPAYTEEARRRRVEGAVVLEVVFGAVGQLTVLRVVRGLGYGLDEAALEAARRIVFKPAMQGGRPADQKATLHVVFQLAE